MNNRRRDVIAKFKRTMTEEFSVEESYPMNEHEAGVAPYADKTDRPCLKDIVGTKFTVFGMTFDLGAAWKFVRHHWNTRKRTRHRVPVHV